MQHTGLSFEEASKLNVPAILNHDPVFMLAPHSESFSVPNRLGGLPRGYDLNQVESLRFVTVRQRFVTERPEI